MDFKTKKDEAPLVEIAPLIDVVFLLLLFFMVTTQFISLPGIKLTLPDIGPGRTITATEKVEIVVTASHDVYVNGNPVPQGGLVETLKRGPIDVDTVVILKADQDVTHGTIVNLIDIIRGVGFKRVVLAARWRQNDKHR